MLPDMKERRTYGNDTSHDNWYNTLHHQVGSQHRHGGNANTRFRGSITRIPRESIAMTSKRDRNDRFSQFLSKNAHNGVRFTHLAPIPNTQSYNTQETWSAPQTRNPRPTTCKKAQLTSKHNRASTSLQPHEHQ